MCWCGDHKCYENDEQNSFMGLDCVYLRPVISDKSVKNNFKCKSCNFDSDEIADIKNHFMENHRKYFMYKCWKCKEETKTISQLKIHYEKVH